MASLASVPKFDFAEIRVSMFSPESVDGQHRVAHCVKAGSPATKIVKSSMTSATIAVSTAARPSALKRRSAA